uniref:Uncharacterized protein n=1 Tax=Candidatus Kentrum sp. FW TaxID=2126338 RepID=A0A450TYU5_9GAMM|nr:MAG: hypothetical protein BECKFW1821C_GA0114237_106813 [Candidatus Kentron sp. FW]
MKIHFVTYGNGIYANALKRIKKEAEDFEVFDHIHVYKPSGFSLYGKNRLSRQFSRRFRGILKMPRGAGYWIWKPCIIAEVLGKMADGDYLVYADAGCEINSRGIDRFREYIQLLDSSEYGCLSFRMEHLPERCWTKRDVFDYFHVGIDSDIAGSGQLIGGVILFKKCRHAVMLIDKWLSTLYDDPVLFTDHCYSEDHHGEFVEHRHDQSIFSIIRKLHGSVVIPDETFYEDWSHGAGAPFLAKRQNNGSGITFYLLGIKLLRERWYRIFPQEYRAYRKDEASKKSSRSQ